MIYYYFIASVNEDGESLVMEKRENNRVGLATFLSFEDAKSVFDNAYKVLTTLPPKDMNERAYYFEQIALIRPVILKIPGADAIKIIKEWLDPQNKVTAGTGLRLGSLNIDLLYVKPGFAEKYKVLDVTKDIESIVSIGQDGRIQLNVFTFTKDGDASDNALQTDEQVDQILRDRGYK